MRRRPSGTCNFANVLQVLVVDAADVSLCLRFFVLAKQKTNKKNYFESSILTLIFFHLLFDCVASSSLRVFFLLLTV